MSGTNLEISIVDPYVEYTSLGHHHHHTESPVAQNITYNQLAM